MQENIQLKSLLGETQTNIAVLRSEMTQIKTNYEAKVTELTSWVELLLSFMMIMMRIMDEDHNDMITI